MKKLLLLCLLTCCFSLNSQSNWFPIGAKWFYNVAYDNSFGEEDYNYIRFEVIRDTVINSKICKVIEVYSKSNNNTFYEYVYEDNNVIYYYNSGNFFTLYDFNAGIGDTIVVHNKIFKPTKGYFFHDSIDNFEYKIIEIDSILVSDKWLKRQEVRTLKGGNWGFFDRAYIIEKIGSLIYFFGFQGVIFPELVRPFLRCYNEEFFLYKNQDWKFSCDSYTKINYSYEDKKFTFNQDPFTDNVILGFNIKMNKLDIFTINGQKLYTIVPGSNYITLNHLKKGIYFITALNKQDVYTYKFIIK